MMPLLPPLLLPPLFAIPFPNFDPVLFEIGPFAIRWYALAYVGGLLLGWWLGRVLVRRASLWGGTVPMQPVDLDDALMWIAIGVVLGGRLAFVLIYSGDYFLHHPLEILMVWKGGMAFHGGFLGAVLAMVLFARARGISALSLLDVAAVVAPIGIFLGRIANFINGEIWGRPSDVPWAMVFPKADDLPRHPAQLYHAFLEGICVAVAVAIAVRLGGLRRPGLVGGVFGIAYGIARIVGEEFREQDWDLVWLDGYLTMGTILSLPMIAVGAFMVRRALRLPPRG